ncbi:hypothetical protein [Streptomyces sp. NPDC006307]|uniref:hypothetical protein n=1 Tax=Streptomyces sp. NPDC006307 TaxID=3156748 RepID=UPI00339EE603
MAIVTSVNAAVLLVATLQYGSLLRRYVDRMLGDGQARNARLGQLLDMRRNGVEPTVDELREFYPKSRLQLFRPYIPYVAASGAYGGFCYMILVSQVRILRWAGTADAKPQPELAEHAFNVAVLAMVLLLLEIFAVNYASGVRQALALRHRFTSVYSKQERRELRALAEAAAVPPTSPTESGDPATEP